MGFLSPRDVSVMRRDAIEFLASEEAAEIFFEYSEIAASGVVDPVYGTVPNADVTVVTEIVRGVQKIVTPIEEDILRWGILQVGDCIFYIGTEVEVRLKDARYSVRIRDASGVYWTPVPRKPEGFHNFLAQRVGGHQIFQVIPANLAGQPEGTPSTIWNDTHQ